MASRCDRLVDIVTTREIFWPSLGAESLSSRIFTTPLATELMMLATFSGTRSSISSMNTGIVPLMAVIIMRALSVAPPWSSWFTKSLGFPNARAAACMAAVLPMPDLGLKRVTVRPLPSGSTLPDLYMPCMNGISGLASASMMDIWYGLKLGEP